MIHLLETWDEIREFRKYIIDNKYTNPKSKIENGKLKLDFNTGEEFHLSNASLSDKEKSLLINWLGELSPELFNLVKSPRLIFGKDNTKGIVSCEVNDTSIEVFIENKDDTVETKVIPHEYWILSPKSYGEGWERLEGNLHYKFIKKYTDKEKFQFDRGRYYKNDIYISWDTKEAAMLINGFTYFKGMKTEDVSVLSFDIESKGLAHNEDSGVLIISNTFRRNGKLTRKLFCIDEFESEAELFDAWCTWVRDCNPAVLLGHNIFGYDLPYMNFCANKAGTSLKLGRDGSDINFETKAKKFRKDGSQDYEYFRCHIYGREIVDTMFRAYQYDFSRKYENYGLKQIIKQEGLEIQGRQFYDAGSIAANWDNLEERKKIKLYAEHDADDALALYDLMIPSVFYLNQSIPKSFQELNYTATGSQINSFLLRSYLQENHSIPQSNPAVAFEGAISFGNPGIYNNVFKVDVASLYPSIMLENRVYDKEKDPNAHFLRMVEYFTAERFKNKKLGKETGDRYYTDLSEAQKIVINSAYGMLAAVLNFNSPKLAAFVTEKGREILQKSIDWATSKTFKIVNADTDSISFCRAGMDFISEDERKLLLTELNSLYPEKIKFADDGYYVSVVVVKAKNYILYDGKKIKTKGSALKASMKEKALKEFINKVIECLVFNKVDELAECYSGYIKEIYDLKDITRWSKKVTITESVLNPARTNEQKVLDALHGRQVQMGDKIFVYFAEDESLKLQEDWNADHDKARLTAKLFDTITVFETVLPMDKFPNYSLVKNQKTILRELLGLPPIVKETKTKKKLQVNTEGDTLDIQVIA